MRIYAYMHTSEWAPATGPHGEGENEEGTHLGRGRQAGRHAPRGESPSRQPKRRGGGAHMDGREPLPPPPPPPKQEAPSAGDPRDPRGT